jgi:RND superfamily putative drug exporter
MAATPATCDAASVFASLGRRVARHPRAFVIAWTIVTVLGFGLASFGVQGQSLFERLSTGAPGVPGAQSSVAQDILTRTSTGGSSLNLLVSGVDPAAPAVVAAMVPVNKSLAATSGVVSVIDPFVLPGGAANPAAAPLLAKSGSGFLLVVDLDPKLSADADKAALREVGARLRQVPADLAQAAPGATGVVGGVSLITDAITKQVEEDLTTGEKIALPVALLIMVLVFGGFLAAAMPMIGAIASIAGGLGSLLFYSYLIDMDASVVNVVTILGLGLSIDYGLLIVSRYREELHRILAEEDGTPARRRRNDSAVSEAVVRTMATAGRTVAFSALTVAISISGLFVFSPPFLKIFGVAGVTVILVAVATALTLVPAMLTLTGRRMARPGLVSRIPLLRSVLARTADVQSEEGAFSALATRVQRRPWWVLGGVLVLLAVLAIPIGQMELRNSTTELLPAGSSQRGYLALLAKEYPASSSPTVVVVAQTSLADATSWTHELAGVRDVASVDTPKAQGGYVVIGVRAATTDPGGVVARGVVHAVRDLDPGFRTWVTGQAAVQIDFTQALTDRAPLAAGIVALATLVLLFLMTGSVVIPIKALLSNAISLSAALGVLVWVFQDGHLSGVLDFVSSGGIETYVLALVIAFAFGLAMDYEVFLLSRIKELHDAGEPDDVAVRLGLQRSGRIITSAAVIIIVVFSGFVAGKMLVIKEVGFALAVAVLIDAVLVRVLLVPATMSLLGKWNWWSPKFLARIYQRLAITH